MRKRKSRAPSSNTSQGCHDLLFVRHTLPDAPSRLRKDAQAQAGRDGATSSHLLPAACQVRSTRRFPPLGSFRCALSSALPAPAHTTRPPATASTSLAHASTRHVRVHRAGRHESRSWAPMPGSRTLSRTTCSLSSSSDREVCAAPPPHIGPALPSSA